MDVSEPTNLDQARDVVAASQWDGVTYKELLASGRFDGEGHGSASGALTRLHADGVIARLTEKRARCSVYVLPAYLGGREHEPYRSYTREARSDTRKMDVPWTLLARLSSCTCDCACGAREGLVATPGDEHALMTSLVPDWEPEEPWTGGPPPDGTLDDASQPTTTGDRTAPAAEVSDEERLLLESDPRLAEA